MRNKDSNFTLLDYIIGGFVVLMLIPLTFGRVLYNSKSPFDHGACNIPLIRIKALFVAIPVFCALSTVSAYCLFLPLKSDVKSS